METTALDYYKSLSSLYAPGRNPDSGEINREAPWVNPLNDSGEVNKGLNLGVGNSEGIDVLLFLAGYDESTANMEASLPTAE